MLRKLNRENAGLQESRPIRVLQFGDGHFLRGFADWIIDILNEKATFNGSVAVIRPLRRDRLKARDEQDGLYHVIQKGLRQGKTISEIRLITCLEKFINPYTEFEGFMRAAENPDLQFIISNTTEAGITFNPTDQTPERMPESFPGKITLLLYHRFKFFNGAANKGVVLLPCELIENNGEALRSIVLQYCALWNLPDTFIHWIHQHNAFCNSLVDRIVPGFPSESIQEIETKTGFKDNLAVSVEPFYLWVIKAPAYVQQSFPVVEAGLAVKFVRDLAPYRAQKVSILNGAHTALVPVAYLYGLRTVKESVDHEYTGSFIRRTIFEEIIPTLDLPEEELISFAEVTLERFQNPFIRHELKSIALNSISKFKVRVLPTILEHKKRKGKLPSRLIYAFACLVRFYQGEWRGETLPVNDAPDVTSFMKEAWCDGDSDAALQKVLSNVSFWGEDLTNIPGLYDAIRRSLNLLETAGVYDSSLDTN